MADTNTLGSIAELSIAKEAIGKGYTASLTFGENDQYDLIIDKKPGLYRVQVKCLTNKDGYIDIPMRSSTGIDYNSSNIDCIIAYDITNNESYWIDKYIIDNNTGYFRLRTMPTKNNQKDKINWAKDYKNW